MVCDERWQNITDSILARSHYLWGAKDATGVQQSTWCKLNPNNFEVVAQQAHGVLPENILFIHQGGEGEPEAASGRKEGTTDNDGASQDEGAAAAEVAAAAAELKAGGTGAGSAEKEEMQEGAAGAKES